MEEVNSAPKDTENLLALAKHYLKTGKYSEAKELLQEAITIDAKSGEVHYFLGITFGYNDQFDEAEKQFEKAAAFGYIP